ncbi:hypothetical protein PCANC_24886 [Puccinia coronata f. sp. avenae]|uniref:Uncharacterized protein n=1 Tax=Puccinia coronata f. sp. avenae TaxID=200324 RepID=A0A2N5S6P5_9BASI|nr:hypothetical protein PCANC_24886 [Puccinia coronata f. sp. avenae]
MASSYGNFMKRMRKDTKIEKIQFNIFFSYTYGFLSYKKVWTNGLKIITLSSAALTKKASLKGNTIQMLNLL